MSTDKKVDKSMKETQVVQTETEEADEMALPQIIRQLLKEKEFYVRFHDILSRDQELKHFVFDYLLRFVKYEPIIRFTDIPMSELESAINKLLDPETKDDLSVRARPVLVELFGRYKLNQENFVSLFLSALNKCESFMSECKPWIISMSDRMLGVSKPISASIDTAPSNRSLEVPVPISASIDIAPEERIWKVLEKLKYIED